MEVDLEERICPGCKLSALTDAGGLVVAFGSSFFHVECFKCAKCSNKVTADTNLLLLSDGSPICANCSYSCNVCNQPILDEAIMTGDDSYHAHCFKCKVCKAKIDELVFAKTSQGIYCMTCHNERMIKIRKHAQKKAEREKAERERIARERNPLDELPTASNSLTTHKEASKNDMSPNVPHTPVAPSSLKVATPRPSATKRTSSYDTSSPITSGEDRLDPSEMMNSRSKRKSINIRLAKPSAQSPPLTPPVATLSPTPASFSSKSNPVSSTPPPESTPATPTHSSTPKSLPQAITSSERDEVLVIRPPARTSSTLGPKMSNSNLDPDSNRGSRHNSHSLAPSRSRSVSRSRSASPAHIADVPENIENIPHTDEGARHHHHVQQPADPVQYPDVDTSLAYTESLEDYAESVPVERVSHSTFIAPALPPIRFSISNGDFSEMFGSNGVVPSGKPQSLKNIEYLTRISESVPQETSLPSSPNPVHSSEVSAPSAPPLDETVSGEPSLTVQSSSHEDGTTSTEELQGVGDLESSERPTPLAKLTRKLSKGRRKNAKDAKESSAESSNGLKVTISGPIENLPSLSTEKATRTDPADLVLSRLRQALADAKERGANQLRLDHLFVEAILTTLETRKADYADLKSKFDGIRRTSKQYIDGLSVAQTEYDKELKARRDAEAEVTRLRVLLSGQAVRLTTLAGDSRKQEMRQQMSQDIQDSLSGLEQDLSKLKAERDMTLAEVEELTATKGGDPLDREKGLGRSLTKRLDSLKVQYERDLVPLISQREVLTREIQELKGVRDTFLEETTVLNARNEELAQLSAQYARRMEMAESSPRGRPSADKSRSPPANQTQFPLQTPGGSGPQASTFDDESMKPNRLIRALDTDSTPTKAKFKNWPPARSIPKGKDLPSPALTSVDAYRPIKTGPEHNFQQLSVLRFTRCDHCGDKMWGSQLRCNVCTFSIHVRCVQHVSTPCSSDPQTAREEGSAAFPPSMFGRDLTDQVRADAKGSDRRTPVIIEKCIEAVEELAMDYEGIYRKTGGSSQSKAITQLFERGDYAAFDLRDTDRFNDICSVTSVLKTYLRTLPDPLLTYDLHDQFMKAVELRDPAAKSSALLELVNKLPDCHYYTLRALMLHLNRVQVNHERNLMSARNLGVVFGPTLMRSRDPTAEFSDMAGKALTVEWLVENATLIFTP